MSDAELQAWFDEQVQARGKKPKADQTAIETLILLRDALVKETKRPRPRRRSPREAGRARR
jgi:hypothetical protein